MTLPENWTTLPGPSDFLSKISSDLRRGSASWAYFPYATLNVSTWIRSTLKDWKWSRLSEEPAISSPDAIQSGIVYWCEVDCDSKERRDAFANLVQSARSKGLAPRICVLARSNSEGSVSTLRGVEGISVSAWSDFVTSTDSRVVVERIGRNRQWSRGYVDFMSSVVSLVARNDLVKANEYARMALSKIFNDKSIDLDDLWIAQLQVLYPKIDSFRRNMIRKYQSSWVVPWEVIEEDGRVDRTVIDIDDLEVSHLWAQISSNSVEHISSRDREDLRRAKKYRNKLAHQKVLTWAEVNSDFSSRIFDIRIPRRRD